MTSRKVKRAHENAAARAGLDVRTLEALDAAVADPSIISFGDDVQFMHKGDVEEWAQCSKLPPATRHLLANVCTRTRVIEGLHELLHTDECHADLAEASEGVEYNGIGAYRRDMVNEAIVMLMRDLHADLDRVFDLSGGNAS